jgi:hypothetical protein
MKGMKRTKEMMIRLCFRSPKKPMRAAMVTQKLTATKKNGMSRNENEYWFKAENFKVASIPTPIPKMLTN